MAVVFGVDLGSLNSVIGVARNGGIDVILNEVSKRETSTFTSFTDTERFIGESGLDRHVRNMANTVNNVKRFIGMRMDDPQLQEELRYMFTNVVGDAEGRVMFEVEYNGEMQTFYPEQVLGMFLAKLRTFVAKETKSDCADCVLSVPAWFTAEQRALVLQAAQIAGLNCMSLINESTASCLDYGIFRGTELPQTQDKAIHVAHIDVGYAATTITIGAFWKGNMKVIASGWDVNLGTRALDSSLASKVADDIKGKYKIDVLSQKRARLRVQQACEKAKSMLSANSAAPLNIENLMDIDVNLTVQRADLEAMCQPVADRLAELCKNVLAKSGLSLEQFHAVEFIGGGSRVPIFKTAISSIFGSVPLSFTLSASESVAKGCAITAAVFSPLFQVREYFVNEAPLAPLFLSWSQPDAVGSSSVPFLPASVNKVIPLLRDTDRYPKTSEFTFEKSEPFDLYATYDSFVRPDGTFEALAVLRKQPPLIGHWTIGSTSKKTNGQVIVTIKFHANGLVYAEKAVTTEEYEVEEKVPVKPDPAAAAAAAPATPPAEGSTEDAAAAPAKPAEPQFTVVKKKKTRLIELAITPQKDLLGHPAESVKTMRAKEVEMATKDSTIQRTKEAKNELEGFVYDFRPRFQAGGNLRDFATVEAADGFVAHCTEFEGWLYEDGQDAQLVDYTSRLDKLKVTATPTIARWKNHDEMNYHSSRFLDKVKVLSDLVQSTYDKHAHITKEELDGAGAKCSAAQRWLNSSLEKYLGEPKYQEPSLTPAMIDAEFKTLDTAVKAVVMKKPPPPPKPDPKPAAAATPAADGAAPAPTDDAAAPPPTPEAAAPGSPKGPEAPADLD